MSVEIIDRGGYKYVLVPQARGRAVRKALRTKSIEEARELVKAGRFEEIALASKADAMLREVWTRLLAGRNLKVRDTVESYEAHRHVIGIASETIRKERQIIDTFTIHAGITNESIAGIEAAHVSSFINRSGPQMLSTRTVYLAVISTWLEYLVEQRWIVKNPAAEVVVRLEGLTQEQLISVPRAPFTDEEVRRLLAVVPRTDFWHGAILFGFHYGLRIGAIATLEEGNIVANRMRLYTRKGRRIVDEHLADEIVAWLTDWQPCRPISTMPYLFPEHASIHESGSSVLSKQFSRLLTKHGISDRSFHGLRKTAAKNRWAAELEELGDKGQRAVIALVAKHGMQKVQEMLAHAPGSDVTEKHYL